MTDLTDRLDEYEARVTRSRLGRSVWRETDDDLRAISKTVDALRAVLDLHRPGSYSVNMHGWTANPVCPTCHDKAGVHPCGCWRDVDEEHDCLGCSRPIKGAHVPWPCPTVQAIADALGVKPGASDE